MEIAKPESIIKTMSCSIGSIVQTEARTGGGDARMEGYVRKKGDIK